MKNIKIALGILIFLILHSLVIAQVPNSFNYQSVVRDAAGELVVNQEISIQLSILEGTETSTPIYTETHSIESNSYGMISLKVGEGNPSGSAFSDINWTSEAKFIKVEADITGNTNFVHIGTSELMSVPFATYAKGADVSVFADSSRISNNSMYSSVSDYSDSTRVANSSVYSDTSVYSNNAVNSDTALVAMSLGSSKVYSTNNDTLFVVKDYLGQAVFAVFPDGVKVIVDQTAKGNVGGFAVSGRNPGKADDISIFSVTPDSTRIYVNNLAKGNVGGFAVSGRNPGKGITEDILVVNSDSTRIYIDESAKGNVGGFAVSGRNPGKAGFNDYFNVSGVGASSLDTINPSEARMLWYPKSEAFLVGRVLVEGADSVGLNSMATGFESKAVGNYSQALGYSSIARGDYSTAIGRNAIAQDDNSFAFGKDAVAFGINSFALGDDAYAEADYAYAIGAGSRAIGAQSFALGSVTQDTVGTFTQPSIALGDFSMALGLGAKTLGLASTSIGAKNLASGDYSTAMGFNSTSSGDYSTALGFVAIASGNRSIALGPYSIAAGYGSTAVGYRSTTEETGSFSFAGGLSCTTSAYGAVAMGANCTAGGSRSVAMGDVCTTSGFNSVAMGKGCDAVGAGDFALGTYNTADGGKSFAFGAYANTNGQEGAFVFNCGLDKKQAIPKRPGEVVFLGSGGMTFYANLDTSETTSFTIQSETGFVGIGNYNPTAALDVSGAINFSGSLLQNGEVLFSDFVFENNYQLETIEEHADFMWKNKHLPAILSAKEIKEAGSYDVIERREQILEELEKAHIYIDQLNNKIKNLSVKNKELEEKLDEIINLLEKD
jgi:hypothetical protein